MEKESPERNSSQKDCLIAALKSELDFIRSSKFWKMRNSYVAMKARIMKYCSLLETYNAISNCANKKSLQINDCPGSAPSDLVEKKIAQVVSLKDKNKKKKVLVIPSWYPTEQAPIVGSFFREQSMLMEDEFDVVVLFGQIENYNGTDDVRIIESYPFTPPETIAFFFSGSGLEEENFIKTGAAYEFMLSKLIDQGWRPDIIHAHSTVYGGIIANYLGKKIGIPTVITEHSVFLLHNYSKFIQEKIYNTLQNANKVLAVSTDKMKFVLMHGIKCDPVVVGNFVDENMFTKINDIKNSKNFEILIVASSSYLKDLPTFFKAIKEIIDSGCMDIHATVVGNGVWGGESYKNYVRDIGIEKYCTFIDAIEREKMPKLYQNCDVFVSTSIAEGFQVSILEAMSCGKPVVSTSHGGVEDVICSENGIILKIRDYKGIADAIISIKEGKINFDPKKIREIVVGKYGKTAFKEKIANIYNELMD